MRSRAEITTKYAAAYVKAPKKIRGQILDQVVEVTGWSRDNARRRLMAAALGPVAGRGTLEPSRPPRTLLLPSSCSCPISVSRKVSRLPGEKERSLEL